MEFEGEKYGVSGCVPEFGAIFMSNSATKEECFRRKLLGLPSGQAYFVKQVKAGMLLFLFEFERRELHGVFQAISDGAMNIVPYAFSSSGKQFPAQVKFTPFWHCSPLPEDEFSDAIRENYYSAKKFYFGLSEDQVHKLLYLFSLRKLKPHRHCSRHKFSSYSTKKFRRAADAEKSTTSNHVEDECDADSSHGSVISTNYFGGRLGKGGSFATSAVGNEHKGDYELGKVTLNDHFDESLHKVSRGINNGRFAVTDFIRNDSSTDVQLSPVISKFRKVSNEVMFATDDGLQLEHNEDNGFAAAIPTTFPGLFQPNGNTTAYTSNSNILRADSSVHNLLKSSSTFCHPMELQVSNLSCPTSCGNAIGFLPYDPDEPSIDSRHSLSHDFAPPRNNNALNVFASSGNQSFLSYGEPQGARRCSDFNSGFGNSFSVPSPNHYHGSCRSRMALLEAANSENMAANSSDNESYIGFSLPRPSSTPVPFSDSGNIDNMNGSPYSFSPSQFPSLLLGSVYPEASQEKDDHERPECGINESFLANFPMLKEDQSQLEGHICSVEFKSTQYHVNSSLKPVVCKNSGSMYSHFQKKRDSVFSRLTLAAKAHVEENGTYGDDEDTMDTSVNEVTSMQHKLHNQWFKMSRSIQLLKDNATNCRMKRQTTLNSKSMKHCFQKISEEEKVNDIPATNENCDQFAEKTSFVDFRRRSEVRKTHKDDTKTGGRSGSAESEGFSGVHKRRKLIRPNFSKNELPDDKSINVDTLQTLKCLSNEDKDIIEVETVSNYKGEEMGETCGAPFKNVDKDGKEVSKNVGIKTLPSSISFEGKGNIAEQDLIVKDSMVDVLSQDLNNTSHFIGQESSLETCEKGANGITLVEIRCCRGSEKEMYQNADFAGEIAIKMVNE